MEVVRELITSTPGTCPTWNWESLASTVELCTEARVSVSTIGRTLTRLGNHWGMARLTGGESGRRAAIRATCTRFGAVTQRRWDDVAYYEDEFEIHLDPRIGRNRRLPGRQITLPTLRKNRNVYVAGALAVGAGWLVTVTRTAKRGDRLLALLERLHRLHPIVRRIHLNPRNCGLCTGVRVLGALAAIFGRVFHFRPQHTSEANCIERRWIQIHAKVTRIPRYDSPEALLEERPWNLTTEGRCCLRASVAHRIELRKAV